MSERAPVSERATVRSAAPPRAPISVIVPTHRRDTLLVRALCSVTSQRLAPVDVIVVDDCGRADALRRLLAEAGLERARVVAQREHPPGAAASRNAGAAAATQPLLAFLDDDDTWHPDYLSYAAAALDARADCAAVVTWLRVVTRPGSRVVDPLRAALRRFGAALSRRPSPWTSIAPELAPRDLLARNPGVVGSNLVVRRAAFDAVGGFDRALPVSHDVDLLLRLLLAGERYAVVRRPLVQLFAHRGARLTDAGAPRELADLRAFERKHAGIRCEPQRRAMARRIDVASVAASSLPSTERLAALGRLVAAADLPRLARVVREAIAAR